MSTTLGISKSPDSAKAHESSRRSTKKSDRSQSVLLDEADQLHALLSAIRSVNVETSMEKAIAALVKETCSILSCDRATVFMVDEITDELVLKIANNDLEIRLPKTAGIAGTVYTTGESLKIDDPYSDERFNQATDKSSGYKTNSILCVPVCDNEANIVAVLQAINKLDNNQPIPFDEEDIVLIEYLASQVGIILRNMQLYEAQIASQKKVQALLDIVRSLHGDMGINSLLFTLTERTPQLIEADRCTVFLVDTARKELTSMHGAVEIRIGMDQGIAGEVATHNKTVNIPDAYKDARFNQEIDKQSGYHTKTILCLPIRDSEGKALGVIQLINKKHGTFSKADEELLEGFLGIAGSILQTSQLFAHNKEKISEFALAMEPATRTKSNKGSGMAPMAIIEDDGEEDGEEDDDDDEK